MQQALLCSNAMARQVTVSVRLPCSVEVAYSEWFSVVWLNGGGLGTPTIKEKGTETGVGCVRVVGAGVTEEILSAQKPNRIEYTVRSGPFPVSQHRGVVNFKAVETETTEVTWICDFVPSTLGRVFLCCGAGLDIVIRLSFKRMLSVLEAKVTRAKARM